MRIVWFVGDDKNEFFYVFDFYFYDYYIILVISNT